eukprot:11834041-Heterocapsa_arctica.AAC.1
MLKAVSVVTPTYVPTVIFVLVMQPTIRARQGRSLYHFRQPSLRPGASCEDVPQCPGVVGRGRVQPL